MHGFKLGSRVLCGLLVCTAVSAWAADDTVLIERGDVTVTENEFKQLVHSLVPEADRADFLGNKARIRKMLVDNYIVEALAVEATSKGVDKEPLVVFRQQYQAKKDLAQYYLNSLLNKQSQPDWEALVTENYIAHKDQFATPEQVRVSHILIAIDDKRDDAAAKLRAQEAYKKAVAANASFEKLVSEYSDDPSAAQNKGDMGLFGKGQMVKPFEDAAFAMTKPGAISEPIKSQFGYHIIKFTERKAAGTRSLEEVKAQLLGQEREKFANAVRERKIAELRDAADVKVDTAAVDALIEKMATEARAK